MNTTIVPWILWDIFYKPQGNEPRQIASTFDSIIENVVDFFLFSNVSSKKSNLMTSYIYTYYMLSNFSICFYAPTASAVGSSAIVEVLGKLTCLSTWVLCGTWLLSL